MALAGSPRQLGRLQELMQQQMALARKILELGQDLEGPAAPAAPAAPECEEAGMASAASAPMIFDFNHKPEAHRRHSAPLLVPVQVVAPLNRRPEMVEDLEHDSPVLRPEFEDELHSSVRRDSRRRQRAWRIEASDLKAKVDKLETERIQKQARREDPWGTVYVTEGRCAKLLRNQVFHMLVWFMIIASVIGLGLDTHMQSQAEIGSGWEWFTYLSDSVLCAFFLLEILMRLVVFREKRDALKDGYFLLDAALVVVSIVEIWIVSLFAFFHEDVSGGDTLRSSLGFRSVRIFRIIRIPRFVRVFPELFVFAKGLFLGARSLVATVFALAVCIYIFAIIFTTMLSDDLPDNFGSLQVSLEFLLVASITSIKPGFIEKMAHHGRFFWLLWLLFLLIANLAILKMMTGVLTNVVEKVQIQTENQSTRAILEWKLIKLLREIGEIGEARMVTKDSLTAFMRKDMLIEGLLDAGVDIMSFMEFSIHSIPREGLPVHELVIMMMKFQMGNPATVRNLAEVHMLLSTDIICQAARTPATSGF